MKNKVGRPSLGITKKVSITLPEKEWDKLQKECKGWDISLSSLLREIITANRKIK